MTVFEDIDTLYESVMTYVTAKRDYFRDPATIPGEYSDVTAEFNLTRIVEEIQKVVPSRPTLVESYLLKAYRDLRSAEAEYAMRLTSRAAYLTDSAVEEELNRLKWDNNRRVINLHLLGKDAGA